METLLVSRRNQVQLLLSPLICIADESVNTAIPDASARSSPNNNTNNIQRHPGFQIKQSWHN
jgi:hypothetical protein